MNRNRTEENSKKRISGERQTTKAEKNGRKYKERKEKPHKKGKE